MPTKNKILGRRAEGFIKNAEIHGTIAPEQFRSCIRKSAINHAINKQITVDILRQEHQLFVLILLDSKSCYDRISPPIDSLCIKIQGAPEEFVALMFNTVQEMEHFIRTVYRDSDT